ncbi:acyltransferase family protein [Agrobacterium fabrum]|uniref:acyltransferase family protein n=1 Tax=Agrobacterium fabrum TaxID=1176649 RepID=UPI00273F2E4A|nr:acyltransferase [Agrobacterium fabrum]WLP57107.1 acyltransferase [Agrobacterium fabrum]
MIINLQALRAVAAFLVFFHHFLPYVDRLFPGAKVYEFGAAGVDIFFVLSGFIMVLTTFGKDRDPAKFFLNRIIRIVPIYWIMTLAIVALFLIGFRPIGVIDLQLSYIWKSLFFIPFTRNGLWEPILSVGWTLNFEIFFYSLFALLLFVPNFGMRIALLVTILICLASSGIILAKNPYLEYYTNPVILDFAIGAAFGAFYVTRRESSPSVNPTISWTLIAIGALLIAVTGNGLGLSYSNNILRPMTWGLAGLMLISGCIFLEENGLVARNRLIIHLGNASYSIYLVHNLMIQVSEKAVGLFFTPGLVALGIMALCALALTTIFGLASYKFIEYPINQGYRRITIKKQSIKELGFRI